MSFFKNILRGMGGHHGGGHGGHHGSGHHGGGYNPQGYPQPNQAPTGVACASCNTINATNSRFCQQCGNSLGEKICASCSSPVQAGAKFCSSCGKPT